MLTFTSAELPTSAVICLSTDVQVRLPGGFNFVPRARKARGLLAVIALSEAQTVSRHQLAVTLWSSVGRASALARLRDVLHNLRVELLSEKAEFLDVQADTILFKPGMVTVSLDGATAPSVAGHWAKFLIGLDGIDIALDRWLTHIRAEGRRGQLSSELARPHGLVTLESGQREVQPAVVVTELDIVGTAADTGLSRALTDELGYSLARLRWFTTITRNSQGQRFSVGLEDLARVADYALIGTLQSDTTHCRLLLNLIDLRSSGAIGWTSSFERHERFCLSIQESFANAAAARLDAELLFIEAGRYRRQPIGMQDSAYRLVLEAIPAIHRLERDPFIDAGHLLEKAMFVERESALAHSWMAYWHVFSVGQGWSTNPTQSMTQAFRAAERAIMLDPRDARAVTISGHVKAFLSRQLSEAAALHELALQINPALVLAWHFSGMTHAYAGRLEKAEECIIRCRELAPNDPQSFYSEGALGIVHLLKHDHESAVALGRRVTQRHPNFTSAFKSYLSALGHLGQEAEATSVLRRLLVLEPQFSLRRFITVAPYQRRDLEHFIAGLRLAGAE